MAKNASWRETPSITGRVISRGDQQVFYTDLTGVEKRDYLFDEGVRPTAYENGEMPDVITGVVPFLKWAWQSFRYRRLPETLNRISDEFEEPKQKLFHTYGTTAKVRFTPEPRSPWSGIFSEEARGLARFSYAGPVLGIGVVPGLGLKFPLDSDNPSENLVVMRKLDRQQPTARFFSKSAYNSVFQNNFTNMLPLPGVTNVIMRIVNHRFETVVEGGRGLHQSADNLARIHTNGELVAVSDFNAPYRLIFAPAGVAKALSDPHIDFRDDLARNIASGTAIYDVFGLSESEEMEMRSRGMTRLEDFAPRAHRMGGITTESEFIASSYGDYRLFFKHSDKWMRTGKK